MKGKKEKPKQVKVIRYVKDSIKRMYWELQALEYDGKYVIWKAHIPKNGYIPTKETEELVTKEQFDKFIEENKAHQAEKYERDFEPEIDKLFNTI